MFRKNYISLFLFIALFTVGGISVFAQDGDMKTVGGTVELKDENGRKAVFEGANITCYRIDVTEGCGSTVSDAEGKFKFEVPKDAKVIFGVSGTGIAPLVLTGVRMDDKNAVTLAVGDGNVPSEVSVRKVAIDEAKAKGNLTKAQKEQLEEIEKQVAEIEAKNAKAQDNNKLRAQYIKEGNDAFNKKDYNLAVEKYTLGYELDPEYIGSAPVFLNNKAVALKSRAVDNYNAAAKTKDRDAIRKAKMEVVKDFTEALNATTNSYKMTTSKNPGEGAKPAKLKEDSQNSRNIIKDVFSLMGKMDLNLASSLATEEEANSVVAIYQTSLGILPDDPDIIAGLALALYSSGDFKGSKEEKKESLAYWNKFKKVAPKDHKHQATADGMIEFLKEEVK